MMDQSGAHKTFQSQNGVMFKFWYTMDNGMAGEVSHKTQTPRFNPGDEVEVTVTTKDQRFPTLKVEKAGGFQQQGAGGPKQGWSKEKEAKIEVQGLVQAAIAGGASTQEQIEAMVALGMKAVAVIAPKVLAKRQAQAPVTNDPPATYQAPPPAQPQYQTQTGVAPSLRQPLPQNPAAGQVYQGAPSQGLDNDTDDAPF